MGIRRDVNNAGILIVQLTGPKMRGITTINIKEKEVHLSCL
jgi:hypothetical protein